MPVSEEIKRAAARAGLHQRLSSATDQVVAGLSSEAREGLRDIVDATLTNELDALRHLADKAELIFETGDEAGDQPGVSILREALRSAKDDFDALACQSTEAAPEASSFRRAELRIDLALALFEYRQEFGYTESNEHRQVREAVEAEQARAVQS